MTRIALLLAAAALVALCLPAASSAAVVDHSATSGPGGEDYIVYRAGGRERNRVTVVTGRNTITFVDPGARIRRKRGDLGDCRVRSTHRAVCRIDPETAVDVLLGNGNDRVRFRGRAAATRLGRAPRSEVGSADELDDSYEEDEGQLGYRAFISGGRGDDVLNGTKADDIIQPGGGRNLVDGGSGRDHIIAAPAGRADRLRGGRGLDTIDLSTSKPAQVDMARGTVALGNRSDRLQSVERVHGGEGNDVIRGGETADGLFGDGGDDQIDGLGGPDYLGGDLRAEDASDDPGVDSLTGGAGDDVLDGRDAAEASGTPTDALSCGDGADTIVARADDLVAACEQSAFGVFTGLVDGIEQSVFFDWFARVEPVARGADGAPTYSIRCPNDSGRQEEARCTGRVELRRPPVAGSSAEPELLGYGEFSFKPTATQNVPVVLNAAGKAVFAQPSAQVSVRVVMGAPANPRPPGSTQQGTPGAEADFGWQQRLTR